MHSCAVGFSAVLFAMKVIQHSEPGGSGPLAVWWELVRNVETILMSPYETSIFCLYRL